MGFCFVGLFCVLFYFVSGCSVVLIICMNYIIASYVLKVKEYLVLSQVKLS